jgi:hypothetical protein
MSEIKIERFHALVKLVWKLKITHIKIGEYSEPPKPRETVTRVLHGDEMYFTEANVTAVMRGMEKIIDEYRQMINDLDKIEG